MVGIEEFDKARLPMTFYAHTLQFIERDAADGRCAVLFEAVEKEEVQMFVTGELPKKFSNMAEQAENFSVLWENFKEGGIASLAFMAKKAKYLGKVGNAEIGLLFHSFAKAKSIAKAKNDWWEITIKDVPATKAEDACLFKITGYERIEEEFSFVLRPISKGEEERLYHLYTQFPKSEFKKNQGSKEAIGPNTTYHSVEVCYVGAALCCRLMEVNGQVSRTAGYFDMGVENCIAEALLSAGNPNARNMNNDKIHIYREVKNNARTVANLGVIISHWHIDHTEILNDLAVAYLRNNTSYATFWQTAQFFYPEVIRAGGWAVTHYNNFLAAVQQAGNANTTEGPYQNANQTVNMYQSPGMEINKCDRDDTNLHHLDHHDHGVWAVVTLNSGHTVFLAGDCAYDIIGVGNVNAAELTNGGNGFDYLVASHHGGKYTHTEAQRKQQYIPTPSQQQSEAFYSANGVAYGHPDPSKVTEYTNRRWNARYTHTLPAQGFRRWVLS